MKHGIFISDVSAMKDSSFIIIFNDIINAKTDGIRFQSVNSKNNLIASNLIYHSGIYNTPSLSDFYVVVPNGLSDVQIKNNFFTNNFQDARVSITDYSILPGSPLIKTAYWNNLGISFDFKYTPRPSGELFDIGAMKYDNKLDSLIIPIKNYPLLYPNPVNKFLTIRYQVFTTLIIELNIYNERGKLCLQQLKQTYTPGIQELQVNVDRLSSGVYFYSFYDGKQKYYGKFIKSH
jgi:hypothetical protein